MLESEARLALLAQGCDPTLGVLHADQRNRDSLALDAMEPVRADVDAFLLDLLEDREFTARDFAELPNGICRIAAPLTHELALTLPHWRECLRPIAAGLAQTFRESLVNKGGRLGRSRLNPGISAAAFPVRSDRRCSQRLAKPRSHARMHARMARADRRSARQPIRSRARCAASRCSSAGVVIARRACRKRAVSMDCERSRPLARRSQRRPPRARTHGERRREPSARRGDRRGASPQSPLGSRASGPARRGMVQARDRAEARALLRSRRSRKATGLSLAACSRIRAGAQVPHPRHWESLAGSHQRSATL